VNAPTLADAVLVTDNTAVAYERKLLCDSQYNDSAAFSNALFSIGVGELTTVDNSTQHFTVPYDTVSFHSMEGTGLMDMLQIIFGYECSSTTIALHSPLDFMTISADGLLINLMYNQLQVCLYPSPCSLLRHWQQAQLQHCI